MSPELETLDQLLAGDLPLTVIRTLYQSDERFQHGIIGILSCGDVTLITVAGTLIPQRSWQEQLLSQLDSLKLQITKQGVDRIK